MKKYICEKHDKSPVCQKCEHNTAHIPTLTCGGDCILLADEFAKRNICCTTCELSDHCDQFNAKMDSYNSEIRTLDRMLSSAIKANDTSKQYSLNVQRKGIKLPIINLLTHGEDCGTYRGILKNSKCKCVPVEDANKIRGYMESLV